MQFRCLPTDWFREVTEGLPSDSHVVKTYENPVPPEVLQSKAEEIWVSSGGKWGTPLDVPLVSYDDMCKDKGLLGVSSATRNKRERLYGSTKRTANSRIRDEYVGLDPLSGQAAKG